MHTPIDPTRLLGRRSRLHTADGIVEGTILAVGAKGYSIRTNEQVADEERVPGEFGENPRPDAVFRIGAAIEVLREQLPALRVRDEVVMEKLKLLGRDLAVAVPPHGIFGDGIADRVLVLRAATSLRTRTEHDRSVVCERSADVVFQRLFVQDRRLGIPDDAVNDDPIIAGFGAALLNAEPMPNIPEMGAVWSPMGNALSVMTDDEIERMAALVQEGIAAGDSVEDLETAPSVGHFYVVANGPEKDPSLRGALARFDNVTVTEGRNGQGVYEAVVSHLMQRA